MKAGDGLTRSLKNVRIKDFIDDWAYRIDLDADYQREKIWSREDQEKLLDSIIKGIDIPKMYLARVNGRKTFDFECIDGKQRMATLLSFYKPDQSADSTLRVPVLSEKYTYKRLRAELPTFSRKMDEYELTFVIYPEIDNEDFLREIFRRLQLGIRLNSGELLKSHTGTIRDFIYRDMGKDAPFLRNTRLSEKRFSRQFTLAQICINSFSRHEHGDFVRARYDDLEDFFQNKHGLSERDENLGRIRSVLKIMEKDFGTRCQVVSSRAVAVSAYLYCEQLYIEKHQDEIEDFSKFYEKLLLEIKENLKLLTKYEQPTNTTILDRFQKYISQASVEPYAVKRRNMFLDEAFAFYQKTKGKIVRH
jgi:hypothetical protein